MVYNRFSIQVVLRVLLLFITLVIWASIFLRSDLIFNQLILLAVTALQLIGLIRFVNKTNKELSRFLDSIRDTDFTARFSSQNVDPSFELLNKSFGDLISKLGETETEKSAQGLFLGALIEEIPFGLIVMESTGQLRFINSQAQRMLDIPNIKNWEALKSDSSHVLTKINALREGRPFLLNHNEQELTVSISSIIVNNEELRIISVKNIRTELRKNETDAWHKLIRVLTHEIMNSVTPIASITETLNSLLTDSNKVEGEDLDDVKEAVATIHARSAGILSFVKRYRQLSRLPEPQFQEKNLIELTKRAVRLMNNQFPELTIELAIDAKTRDLAIASCDESQIDQVLINLIKNAVEASESGSDSSTSVVKCILQESSEDWVIHISDNGSGITEKQLERIFIPFYTTKRDGSGIGLGLSRQIIQNHNGSLTCESIKDPTIFSVTLPKLTAS